MVINPAVLSTKTSVVKPIALRQGADCFKSIMASKKANKISEPTSINIVPKTTLPSINKVVESIMNNHEQATQSVRASMVRTNYTPEQLLGLQYKTGMLFMTEQMFCKTAELSANTFKNFTQMQI